MHFAYAGRTKLLCRLGLHALPAVRESEGWVWPLRFTCARCGGAFIDYGPEH